MSIQIINSDAIAALSGLPDCSVNCCVTSPPYYGLRDYGMDGQIGLEATSDEFVARLVEVFREVRRVLTPDGTCWVNLGDSYCSTDKWGGGKSGNSGKHTKNGDDVPSWAYRERKPKIDGIKPKDLIGIPWRVAFALQADGWYLRQDIIWAKPNPMPESVTDRCTKAHEYVFLLTKSAKYFYDHEAVREGAVKVGTPAHLAGGRGERAGTREGLRGKQDKQRGHARRHDGFNGCWDGMTKDEQQALGRNKRSVWSVATQPFSEAHFATFPPALIEPMIKAGCPVGGVVLDPFGGAGTTGLVADRLQRNAILIELNPEYAAIAERRINGDRGGLLDSMETAAKPEQFELLKEAAE